MKNKLNHKKSRSLFSRVIAATCGLVLWLCLVFIIIFILDNKLVDEYSFWTVLFGFSGGSLISVLIAFIFPKPFLYVVKIICKVFTYVFDRLGFLADVDFDFLD